MTLDDLIAEIQLYITASGGRQMSATRLRQVLEDVATFASVQTQGPPGPQGDPGADGADGTNGADGTDGADGLASTPAADEGDTLYWSAGDGMYMPTDLIRSASAGGNVEINLNRSGDVGHANTVVQVQYGLVDANIVDGSGASSHLQMQLGGDTKLEVFNGVDSEAHFTLNSSYTGTIFTANGSGNASLTVDPAAGVVASATIEADTASANVSPTNVSEVVQDGSGLQTSKSATKRAYTTGTTNSFGATVTQALTLEDSDTNPQIQSTTISTGSGQVVTTQTKVYWESVATDLSDSNSATMLVTQGEGAPQVNLSVSAGPNTSAVALTPTAFSVGSLELGFFAAPPVAQTAIADIGTPVTDADNKINELLGILRGLGIVA